MAFELNGEQVCKAKWASWFKDGGWSVTDLTQKASGQLQIPALLNKIRPSVKDDEALSIVKRELLTYLSNLNFPCDGDCHRGRFMFCFDFKFIGNSKHGIFANKADYDKYWSWRKPWFYLFFYVADRDKRYMHQIRNPAEYPQVLDGAYYDVTRDCFEAEDYKIPITFPIPTADMSELESLALIFAANRWCDNGCKEEVAITPADYAEARPLLNKSHPLISKVLRKSAKALKKR
jgi:hypothetical protein